MAKMIRALNHNWTALEVTFVPYHSEQWGELVEQGWITAEVN